MDDQAGGLTPPTAQSALNGDAARIGAELVRVDGGTDPFAAMVRATRMPMIVTDPRLPDNPVIFANDSFCRMSGYEREEILGRNCRFLQGPETDSDTVGRIRAAVAAAEAIEIDIRNHRKDGTLFWNRLLLAPVRDAAGELAYFFASQVDVTLQRERLAGLETHNAALLAENADRLRAQEQSEARIARILDTTPAGIIELDADGRIAYANPAAERVLGAARGGLVARRYDGSDWNAAAPDGTPVVPEHRPVAQTLRGEVVMDCEQAVTTLDGRRAVLLVDAVPVRGPPCAGQPDGRVEGALVAFQDVTARQQAVQALRGSEERLRALLRASSDALYRMNSDWTEMRQLSGGGFLSDTDAPNRAWLEEYIHPDDQGRVAAAIQEVVRTKGVFELEHRVRRADGTLGWTHSRAVPLLDPDGGIREWFGAASDVTARKEAEAALRHANEVLEARVAERTAELSRAVDALRAAAEARVQVEEALRQSQKMEAVGQLTGGIAHDFNNMLQAIGGGLEMAQRRVVQGRVPEVSRYVEAARQTVARAAALTHRLLAFARRQTLQPKAVEPDALIEGMAELVRQTVGAAIVVELDMGNGPWSVLCDPNQLENVLLNLAINARDAMPDGGQLAFGTRDVSLTPADVAGQDGAAPGDYVEIAVADTGTGMDEATRARAFEPFFTTKPIGQGTGLGLSQLYGFVRQSNGIVRLDSAPGRGTTVRMYLPRHEPAQQEAGQPNLHGRVSEAGANGTVLLVEDEVEVRATAADRLRELGCTVLEADDGPAALTLLRGNAAVDLLITDVGLPGGLNGRQVADAARERRPGLPVLFITGYAGTVLDSKLAPNMAVLGKPFALDALAAKARAMLDAAPAT